MKYIQTIMLVIVIDSALSLSTIALAENINPSQANQNTVSDLTNTRPSINNNEKNQKIVPKKKKRYTNHQRNLKKKRSLK